jgi:hypothetical protein
MANELLIDPELSEFLQSGVSIHVASRDAANVACINRGIGCRVSPDRRQVTVFMRKSQCQGLLADFAVNGAITFVGSEPSTHRTVQLKGSDARQSALHDGDGPLVDNQCAAFAAGLVDLGYDATLGPTLLGDEQGDIVAVTFTPSSAFLQTPGPGAGNPLVRQP